MSKHEELIKFILAKVLDCAEKDESGSSDFVVKSENFVLSLSNEDKANIEDFIKRAMIRVIRA